MKKLLFALIATSLATLAISDGAYAQNTVSNEAIEPQVQKNFNGDKTILPATQQHVAMANAISPKALKNFTKSFKGVSGESWEKIDHGYSAKFASNGVNTRLYYDAQGNWSGSLKGYTEDKMARDLRSIVKREYYDYTITYVQEAQTIESNGIPTYIIHVEDKDYIKLLRIYDGQMSIWKAFKRQS
ncbi:MAG: hypothetical protein ABIN94_21705 [Ferruginibacter sp.]